MLRVVMCHRACVFLLTASSLLCVLVFHFIYWSHSWTESNQETYTCLLCQFHIVMTSPTDECSSRWPSLPRIFWGEGVTQEYPWPSIPESSFWLLLFLLLFFFSVFLCGYYEDVMSYFKPPACTVGWGT